MSRSQSRTPKPAAESAAPHAERRTRTGPERTAEHRGGEWGRGVAARLRALLAELGTPGAPLGVRRFAERVGLSPSLVSSYLNGTRLPDAETLRQLAERTGVSLDWLLMGDGGDAPQLRGVSRTRAELADDLAVYVGHQLVALLSETPELPRLSADELAVNGPGILLRAIDQSWERFYAWLEAASASFRAFAGFQVAALDLLAAAAAGVSGRPADDQHRAATGALVALVGLAHGYIRPTPWPPSPVVARLPSDFSHGGPGASVGTPAGRVGPWMEAAGIAGPLLAHALPSDGTDALLPTGPDVEAFWRALHLVAGQAPELPDDVSVVLERSPFAPSATTWDSELPR